MTSKKSTKTVRHRPKGIKRELTRTKLLDAALDLTREKGLEETTLDDIARRAGMTTGAIYGNFKNRDELFMALAQRQWTPIKPKVKPGDTFGDLMRSLSRAVIASLPGREAAAVGALTFRAYALKHPAVRTRFVEIMATGYEAGADWLSANFSKDQLPMPAEVLVRVINAMIEGLVFQRVLTPELMPDRVIHAAFAALAE
jgi:AcrR family transcriptional regulator